MTICSLYCTHIEGVHIEQVFEYDTQQEMAHHYNHITVIKNDIKQLHNSHQAGCISQDEYLKSVTNWLQHCWGFVNTWGNNKVPRDILYSMGTVEEGLK